MKSSLNFVVILNQTLTSARLLGHTVCDLLYVKR